VPPVGRHAAGTMVLSYPKTTNSDDFDLVRAVQLGPA
jgi:hypothetical protein